jgi:hypothetical protein
MRTKLLFLLQQSLLDLRDWLAPAPQIDASPGEFVKGINLGGKAVTIEGQRWDAYSHALVSGLSVPGAEVAKTYIPPRPHASSDIRKLLNTVIFKPATLEISQTLPNGTYSIYLWIMENFQSNWHSLNVSINGKPVAQGIGHFDRGSWAKYGPYPAIVTDSALHLAISNNDPNLDAHLMGLSIYRL